MWSFVLTFFTFVTFVLAEKHIVVFRPGTPEENIRDNLIFFHELHQYGELSIPQTIDWITFNDAHSGLPVKAYIADIHPYILEDLSYDANIEFIEKDSVVHTMMTHQRGADWGLARICQRNFTDSSTYTYNDNDGEGVTTYVIDTGVMIEHNEFKGRAKWGITIPDNDEDKDGNGHGTHVAGIIAGKTYGVAKKANIVAVKVLRSNGSGSMSDVLKGIEWVVKEHAKNKKGRHVANLSLGGGYSQIMNKMVDAAVAAGIHFVVAAGNENDDACFTSPASARNVVTVGASDVHDVRAAFSNWGRCVNIFAPGHQIVSAWNTDPSATMILSGTSMASPFVAGVVTSLLSREKTSLSPKEMLKVLSRLANDGLLQDVGKESPNLLVYSDPPESVLEHWRKADRFRIQIVE